ncbi:MAG: alpha/beta hydrolase [Gammaproteobacteria bacterium]|nr:alpha/beta hydrolase [Gammaproteobacteria bacterium]
MAEKIVRANGIDIWTEDFGDPADPLLLLIMGASAQGIYWHEGLVQAIVDRGRYVIRYDNRDTGQSTCFEVGAPPYTLDDMAADAVGVLDAYGIATADVAGASMGGMIVQALALQHRDRIRSATIIMSSPLSGGGAQPELGSDDLPGPDPEWMAETFAMMAAPVETREEKIAMRIEMFRRLAGSAEPFDEERQRDIATREVDRAKDFAAMNNHGIAIGMSSPPDRRPLLKELDVPALVVHGTEDPILPYAHGVALAETIPGASFLTLEGAGHEMPDMYLDGMIDAMMEVSARAG